MNDTVLIARRTLMFTSRDNATPRPCTVGITAPRTVSHDQANESALHDAMAACDIVFEGIAVPAIEVRGGDSLQAIAHAAEVDSYLRGIERDLGFEFFWDDGTPYFEQSI